MFLAPAEVPPMVFEPDVPSNESPESFPGEPGAALTVPTMFPWTRLELLPTIAIPSREFPETRLPDPAEVPPTVVEAEPFPRRMPWPRLAITALPEALR